MNNGRREEWTRSRLLLDVVVRESTTILGVLASENKMLVTKVYSSMESREIKNGRRRT